MWMVSFMFRHLYLQGKSLHDSLDRRGCWNQSRSGLCREKKNLLFLMGIEHWNLGSPARIVVNVLIALSWLFSIIDQWRKKVEFARFSAQNYACHVEFKQLYVAKLYQLQQPCTVRSAWYVRGLTAWPLSRTQIPPHEVWKQTPSSPLPIVNKLFRTYNAVSTPAQIPGPRSLWSPKFLRWGLECSFYSITTNVKGKAIPVTGREGP
jgi:hypothetical protein